MAPENRICPVVAAAKQPVLATVRFLEITNDFSLASLSQVYGHEIEGGLRRTSTTERRELKQRQTEMKLRIEQHQDGEESFRTTLESLISMASRTVELFERSNIEQKRQLLAFAFSNLQLRGKKLEF